MKKFFALVVCLAAMTVSVQAQGIKFGVKGGLNITKMSFSKDVFASDNKAGFFIGPSLKLSLPAGFGADIAVLYDERSAAAVLDASQGSISQQVLSSVSPWPTRSLRPSLASIV